MNLRCLLKGVDIVSMCGADNREIRAVTNDHRDVKPGYLFVCYAGVTVDGHNFISQALQKGAVAIVGERLLAGPLSADSAYIETADARLALSLIAANWHNRIHEKLKLIGVTGTNGKTSTAYLVHSIFKAAGRQSAIMGTVGHRYGNVSMPAVTTTPDALTLHGLFCQIANAGLKYVIMETSSQGLAQRRLAGLTFETAAFTNLTQDHLDYHKTMEEYLDAKIMLFHQICRVNGLALLNADDQASDVIRQKTAAPICTYGIEKSADLTARDVESTLRGLAFTVSTPQGDIRARLRLLGHYNLYNALCAVGVALHHGCSPEEIIIGLGNAIVPGRFELVDRGQDFSVVVDYAHTPHGLENLLMAAREISTGRLISVFGCGGDRDRAKRPKMGKISAILADYSVVTSDNPRTENPDRIFGDILAGLPEGTSYDLVPDRREAIGHAIRLAQAGDLVTIAGKGHEGYQVLCDRKICFDDREIAAEFLERRR